MDRTYRARLVALAAASGLLLTIVGMSAANALSCNNCVDAGDVVNSTLTGTDIKDASVGVADLAKAARSAVFAVTLRQNEAIPAGDAAEFDAFTVTVPATGRLLVRVEGAVFLDYDAPGPEAVTAPLEVGLCTAGASLTVTDCGDAYVTLDQQDADDTDAANESLTFSLSRVFSVTAGVRTFYLNGRAAAGDLYLQGGQAQDGAIATAMFFPVALTMTTDAPTP